MKDSLQSLAEQVLRWARAAGADDAEVSVHESTDFVTQVRMGSVEILNEATSRGLQIRVFVGQRMARAATSDMRPETLQSLVVRAVGRARLSSPDPFAGLPEESGAVADPDRLRLYDERLLGLSPEEKIRMAQETERVGLNLDTRIKNSGGAGCHTSSGFTWLANTRGFAGGYRSTSGSLSVHLLGNESDGASQVSDYWYTLARRYDKLETPEQVARQAVERVRRHFGARKIPTQEVPVVFEPELAAELLSDLFGAVAGQSVYLRRSFLADELGKPVASPEVTVVDDGLLPEGMGSRPFDREGVASQRTVVFEKGVLERFLCGSYSARKLKLRSTGNGTGNGERPTNFYLAGGSEEPRKILGDLPRGLYLTRMIGQGVNLVTGDYSRGAFGLWIENGQVAYPVNEITVSGNLRRMLAGIERVGNDLTFRDRFSAPTLQIDRMTVSGT